MLSSGLSPNGEVRTLACALVGQNGRKMERVLESQQPHSIQHLEIHTCYEKQNQFVLSVQLGENV
jgi:hypothetical protein